MMHLSKALFLLSIVFIAFSCSTSDDRCYNPEAQREWMRENGKLKVLCTLTMIEDMVKQVGGQHVDTISLISGQLDPHSYQLVKGDDEKMSRADLIFCNGLELEHGPSFQRHMHNEKVVAIGDAIRYMDPGLIIEINGHPDPHVWMDISLWAKGIDAIVVSLSNKLPDRLEEFLMNAEALHKTMIAKHDEVRSLLQSIPQQKRYLVTSHDAFNYFTRAYLATPEEKTFNQWSKRFAAPEGLAPESQLSTTDIKKIIDHLEKYDIEVLFPESNVSNDSIRKIMQAGREKGLNLRIADRALFADAMGCPGTSGDTYLKMIEYDAKAITSNLGTKEKAK